MKSLLLFALNWLDAQLTIVWVRNGMATEANGLMSRLLQIGDMPFLFTKLALGAAVAWVLYRWSYLPVARNGMRFVLALYSVLFVIHAATGISGLWWCTSNSSLAVAQLPRTLVGLGL